MDNNNSSTNTIGYEQWKTFCSLFAGSNTFKGLLITELDSYRYNNNFSEYFPELTNIALDIIVTSGVLNIKVDNREYLCTPELNNFISINHTNTIQNITISENFKGSVVAVNRLFLIKYFSTNSLMIPIDHIMVLRFNVIYTFAPLVINNLLTIVRKTDRNISRNIFCQTELTIIALGEFYLERLVVQLSSFDFDNINKKKSRKSSLCLKFCNLVIEHCKEEHEVGFYADKLCITPQYLTRILQETYNKSAKNIIDSTLISEASILLYSDKSLQQIADILNFADQSSFGKFFKKITGHSPSSFRALSDENTE